MNESRVPTAARDALQALLGERLKTDPADRWTYGYDNSKRQAMPDLLAYPQDESEICAIMKICNEHHVPVTGRGLGSGTAGAAVPVHGGLVLALEHMNRILKIDPANRLAVVQPGVTNAALQEAAAEHGFFWPPDPTSQAYSTVGGNLACNSAGPRAVKYGTPRDNTLGLKAVTGDGKILRTGVCTTKGVVGYDLTRLLIGSEGTLGIITEATLKLTPLQPARHTLRAVYDNMGDAAAAVSRIMAQPVTPCALEFIDHTAIEMIRQYVEENHSDTDLPANAGAMLIIEIDGDETFLAAATDRVEKAASGTGLVSISRAASDAEKRALWAARKALSPALRKVAPKKINEDIVVPVSRMAELITSLQEISAKFGITIVNFGHAGNGNIHVNLLADPDDPQQMSVIHDCLASVFELVLALDGTLSGEHGIGYDKKEFVALEIEPDTLEMMRRIKQQFDPNGILNPGKLFPEN